ncbi:TPA: GGDEF domain-containing protein [Klebsiella pneumoniae]|nr:sensor domain-containing diguanylate cyclase [Klebsiella quasipneumoniae]HCS8994683.1 GGDEF domain-containing protein [Klebsiella pneumoniae]
MPIKRYRLRTFMLSLSVGSVLLTSILLLSALTLVQKGNIENSLLEGNIAYARKLADTTDHYLSMAQQELAYSAGLIVDFQDWKQLQAEADRLRLQSGFFNSVLVVKANAVVAATSPESLSLVGMQLHSPASQQSIISHKPFISQPFTSATGNYVVFLSQPIFSQEGQYLGYIGGTIYLKKHSILSEILGQHFYGNQAEVSIVAADGRVIYSRDPVAVGRLLDVHQTHLTLLSKAKSGRFVDHHAGKDHLIGFASLQQADWKVFIAGTSDNVSRILKETMISAFWFTLAIIILATCAVIYFSARISRPLERLASFTGMSDSETALRQLAQLEPGYQEAELLREAISQHLMSMTRKVSLLTDEAMTDPLTSLLNRKGFTTRIKALSPLGNHCVISIDIDHFKYINDRYGHDVGDAVLVSLGRMLRVLTRQNDIVCRFGGEEFIILLPDSSLKETCIVAERIRTVTAETPFADGIHITLSAGIAAQADRTADVSQLLRQADIAMYKAKSSGRNRVCTYDSGHYQHPEYPSENDTR